MEEVESRGYMATLAELGGLLGQMFGVGCERRCKIIVCLTNRDPLCQAPVERVGNGDEGDARKTENKREVKTHKEAKINDRNPFFP